jgi:nitrate reductase molybdenum cofactor assembly chaperone
MSDPTLKTFYATVAELWVNPADVDQRSLRERAIGVARAMSTLDEASASALRRFLESPPVEDYVELFELDPKCPLYLGAHAFEEPTTCAGAAVSDRNDYMIDLLGVYKHFRLAPNGRELPDYLPLIIELFSLTAGSPDPMRRRLAAEYVLPYLPALRASLERLRTPYIHLLDAFECALTFDLARPMPRRERDPSLAEETNP